MGWYLIDCQLDVRIDFNLKVALEAEKVITQDEDMLVSNILEILITLKDSESNDKQCFSKVMMIKLKSMSVEVNFL
jgi:hypothetical protein